MSTVRDAEVAPVAGAAATAAVQSPWRRFWEEFAESRLALLGLGMLAVIVLIAVAAPLISPQNPYDLGQLDVMDSKLAPGEPSADGKR